MSNRGKPKRTVYAYTEDGVAKQFECIAEAAVAAQENPQTIRACATQQRISTRTEYLYTFDELTPREVQDKYDEFFNKYKSKQKKRESLEKITQRSNGLCKENEGQFEYEVDCFDREVTYIPRNRQARINLLKNLIWTNMEDRWMRLPKAVAALEKRAYKELLRSLE